MKKNLAIILLAACLCVAVVASLNSANARKTEIDKLQQSITQMQTDLNAADAQIAVLEGEKAALQAELDAIAPPRILTIERATFSITNGKLWYSFVVYNADKELAFENPEFRVWIYDGNGDVIHEEKLTLDTIEPDQRIVYESEVMEMAQAAGGAVEQILTEK